MAVIVGMDGCPGGWLGVARNTLTGALDARVYRRLDELAAPPDILMIDIPIGLPASGSRDCDREARRKLTRLRGSSVFPAPLRPMLGSDSYEEACRIGMAIHGLKISRQCWHLFGKIREADAFVSGHSGRMTIREVHPELCFWSWNGRKPMAHGKRTAQGRAARLALVESAYGGAFQIQRAALDRRDFNDDDLLDAFAALWTGERFAAGMADSVPATQAVDSHGLRMEIVF